MGARNAEWRIRDAHMPAQRVTRADRVERRQLAQLAAEYCGGKGQNLRAFQAPGPGFLDAQPGARGLAGKYTLELNVKFDGELRLQ